MKEEKSSTSWESKEALAHLQVTHLKGSLKQEIKPKGFFFVYSNLTTAALQVEEVKVEDGWVNNGTARLPSPRLLLVLNVGL